MHVAGVKQASKEDPATIPSLVVKTIYAQLLKLLSSHQPAYHVYSDCVTLLSEDFHQTGRDWDKEEYWAEFELQEPLGLWVFEVSVRNDSNSLGCHLVRSV